MRKKSAPQNPYLQEDMQSELQELRELRDEQDVRSRVQGSNPNVIDMKKSNTNVVAAVAAFQASQSDTESSRKEDPVVNAVTSQNLPAKRAYQEAFNTNDNITPTKTPKARPNPAAQHSASMFQQQHWAHLNAHLPANSQATYRLGASSTFVPELQQNGPHQARHFQAARPNPGARPAVLPHQNDRLHTGHIPIDSVNTQSTSKPAVQEAIPPQALPQEHSSAQQISARGNSYPPGIIQITNCHVVFNVAATQSAPQPQPQQIVPQVVHAQPLQPSANQDQNPEPQPQRRAADQPESQFQNQHDPRAAQQPGQAQKHAAPQNGYGKAPDQTVNTQQIQTRTASPLIVSGPSVVPPIYYLGFIGRARLEFTQHSARPNVELLSLQLQHTVTCAIHVSREPIPESYLQDPKHINVVVDAGEGIFRERLLGVLDFVREARNRNNTILVYYQSCKNEARAVVLAIFMEFDRSCSRRPIAALDRFTYSTEGKAVINLFARYSEDGISVISQHHLMSASLGDTNASVAVPQAPMLQHPTLSTIIGQSQPVIPHRQNQGPMLALGAQNASNPTANGAQDLQPEKSHPLPSLPSAQTALPVSIDPQLLMGQKKSSIEGTHFRNGSTKTVGADPLSSSSGQPSNFGSFKPTNFPPSDAHPYSF